METPIAEVEAPPAPPAQRRRGAAPKDRGATARPGAAAVPAPRGWADGIVVPDVPDLAGIGPGRVAAATRAKRPLPLSVVSDSCAFRPAIFAALREQGLEWRAVFENGNIEATIATVRVDLAVTALLASTVPPDLDVLAPEAGLPALPSFAISLRLPPSGVSAAGRELVRHLREGFRQRMRDVA